MSFTAFYCGEFIDNNDERNWSAITKQKIPSKLNPAFIMKYPI